MIIRFPHSTAEWALFLSVTSIALSVVTFVLGEWRRRERVSVRFNPRFNATFPGDEHFYRTHSGCPSKTGPCVRVTITYQGRHSYTVKNVYLVARGGTKQFLTLVGGPFELRDGQALDFIHEHPSAGPATGVVVEGKDLSQHFAGIR